jgi:hypothetical protein
MSSSEHGSALLIVFVFAAIVAISLYMELPVAAFEAQRQREQLLISRGKEYAHAVKLFVRKTGHYPAALKELEDTNRMRFLRHDFADPFTGKKDWRLLHAGPGGAIIDSKVKGGTLLPGMTPGQATNGNTGTTPTSTSSFGSSSSFGGSNSSSGSGGSNSSGGFGSSSSFGGNSSNSGFGNDSFAKPPSAIDSVSNTDQTRPEVVVQQPKQRAPAVAANGQTGAGSPTDASADAALALPPPIPGVDAQPGSGAKGQQTAAQTGAPNTGTPNAGTGGPGNPQVPVDANGAPDAKASMLAAQTGARPNNSRFGSSQSQLGVVQSGGIAGVASKAGGHSIKTVNEQDDYSLWEFYYDPRKDTAPGGVQMGAYAQQQNGAQPQGAFGGQQNGSGGAQQNGLGGAQQNGAGQSSFGQGGGFGQGSFGQSGNGGQSSPSGQGSTPATGANQNTTPGNDPDPSAAPTAPSSYPQPSNPQ